ncbi:hypothetical protein EDM56_09265 [Brevibacillus fluminis]|uniref:Uncharacterized protein n=1 Tax=Brevibacillus fluminis TaxID=511487 RepID=A0A3M8DTI4_9BACL|nr:hypothetical protein EDM56_09265 [Brevibacillus fluminis]
MAGRKYRTFFASADEKKVQGITAKNKPRGIGTKITMRNVFGFCVAEGEMIRKKGGIEVATTNWQPGEGRVFM